MKIVTLDNKYCQAITDDKSVLGMLRSRLSYRPVGVEYTKAYMNGWDGITYLISKKGVFSLGLLPMVKDTLQQNGITFEEQDRRAPVVHAPEINIEETLTKLSMAPREHQIQIVNTALNYRKGIIRACTGSGKTLCTAMITAKLNKPTIIYVIGLDLLEQFHRLFSHIFTEPIGYVGNGICRIERINIATVWTIGRALKVDGQQIYNEENEGEEDFKESHSARIVDMIKGARVHIFDESHVITTNTIKSIHETIDPEYIYGFSGTPFRDDNTDLLVNGILGEQIINISASHLIAKGLLAKPIIKFVPVPKMDLDSANYPSAYKNYVVENDTRNKLVVDYAQKLLQKGYIPLVLFKQIKHGEILLELFNDRNIRCAMLYGDDSTTRRMEVKNMLINREIEVILASTIYDLGVDIPELSGLVLAGGGKSSIRCLQRVGRVIRGLSGKKHAVIIDFADQAPYLDNHSRTRYKIYTSENGFDVAWPKEEIKKTKRKRKNGIT